MIWIRSQHECAIDAGNKMALAWLPCCCVLNDTSPSQDTLFICIFLVNGVIVAISLIYSSHAAFIACLPSDILFLDLRNFGIVILIFPSHVSHVYLITLVLPIYGLQFLFPICMSCSSLEALDKDYNEHSFSHSQRLKDEVQRRRLQSNEHRIGEEYVFLFTKTHGHEQFHASLNDAGLASASFIQECQQDLHRHTANAVNHTINHQCNGQKFVHNPVSDEPIESLKGTP